MDTSKTMLDLKKIKEQCSFERLARTAEEDRRHLEEVIKRAEARLGRPIKAAGNSAPAEKELARA